MIDNGKKRLYDLEFLNQVAGNDIKFIKEILTHFIISTPESVRKLYDSYHKNDWGGVKFEAHKYSSTAITVGLHKLVELLKKLELFALKDNKQEKCLALIMEIESLSGEAITEIKNDFDINQ